MDGILKRGPKGPFNSATSVNINMQSKVIELHSYQNLSFSNSIAALSKKSKNGSAAPSLVLKWIKNAFVASGVIIYSGTLSEFTFGKNVCSTMASFT